MRVMMLRLQSYIHTFLQWLARPALAFYALPWLLLLLVLGTVAQRYIGLYHSERLFFGSFLLWIGPVPLPGAYTTLSLLSLSVLAKLCLKSPLRKRSIGVVVTHASVLVLLLGGLISAVYREEGYITLFQDETTGAVADYHDRELVILRDKKPVVRIAYEQLRNGGMLTPAGLPFSLRVNKACYPCTAEPLEKQNLQAYGMATTMRLIDSLPSSDDSQNRAGAMLEIVTGKPEQDGTYLVFEMLKEPPEITVKDEHFSLEMRPAERPLPFSVQLKHFEQENHPGTTMAREYRSEVLVKDGALQWSALISMNEPLRYRGYTIYQSSFIDNGEKRASVLAVVKNIGWFFPYLSITALCVGLLLHLFLRVNRSGAKASTGLQLMCAIALLLAAPAAKAEPPANFDFHALAYTPILHEGRIKPIDSFARALLKGISGESNLKDVEATAWLAEVICNPEAAAMRPVFIVHSSPLLQALGLPKRANSRYSFNELAPALAAQDPEIRNRDPKTLSESERELVHLLEVSSQFVQLMNSLSVLMPVQDIPSALRDELGLPKEGELSFFALLKIRHVLMDKLKAVVARKQNNIAAYTPLEQDIARLAFQIDTRDSMQRSNALFRVIPGQWDDKEEWLSLWAVVERGEGSPQSAQMFSHWEALLHAWQKKDAAMWNATSQQLHDTLISNPAVRPHIIWLEAHYNAFNPLNKSMILYGAALALMLATLLIRYRIVLYAASLALISAVAVHSAAVLARMIILQRPPVSTLYESMLFVSLIAALLGIFISWRKRSLEGSIAGSIVAISVLYLAGIFAGDGDTLEMLTAVLNTNFWLATHVVCITAGYGFSLLVGVLAHIYLFRRVIATSQEALARQFRLLHTLALIALFFTTTGTMLGGIWADQSWGRFWGWDPKENGALAIVIWLIWALHGRISGHLREVAFASVLALITIIVAMAWVGVNLLSVGLHSYGFSNAAAWGLPIFCLTETGIVAMLALLACRLARRNNTLRD